MLSSTFLCCIKLVLEKISNLCPVQLKYILPKNAFHDAKDDCNTSLRIVTEVFTKGPQYKHQKGKRDRSENFSPSNKKLIKNM